MHKDPCDDHGKTMVQREVLKDDTIKEYVLTACSKCGTPVAKDLVRIYPPYDEGGLAD